MATAHQHTRTHLKLHGRVCKENKKEVNVNEFACEINAFYLSAVISSKLGCCSAEAKRDPPLLSNSWPLNTASSNKSVQQDIVWRQKRVEKIMGCVYIGKKGGNAHFCRNSNLCTFSSSSTWGIDVQNLRRLSQ